MYLYISIAVYYIRIWLRLTSSSFQVALISRLGAVLFVVAKLLRFGFFLTVVILIVGTTKSIAGYTLLQSVVFFLTYNFIDTLTQLLFRDVYRFRPKIVSGDFDLVLVKPMSPLFRVLLGGADPLDIPVLVLYTGLLIYLLLQVQASAVAYVIYIILIVNAFLIATAFHILVLALGIITTEVDHAMMIYRDLTSLARFPVDIYTEPLRTFITFVIPIGIMMTFPPKALFGLLSLPILLSALVLGIGILFFSLKLWLVSLTKYTSASS